MTKKKTPTRVMVFGTFDVLHKGHLNFFRQARNLAENSFLIVSVARDKNVKKIKGSTPSLNEEQRLKTVKKVKLVNKAVLGEQKGYLKHIVAQRPQIIALGHDQKAYTLGLKQKLANLGLEVSIKRLKAHRRHIYRSSLVKKKLAK